MSTVRGHSMLVRCGVVAAAMTLTGCGSHPPTPAGAAASDVLLAQLAASPEVRQYLFYRTDLPGMVLRGLNTLGEAAGAEPVTRTMYVWLECGNCRTGPGARSLSGGADQAIVTVRDDAGGLRVERVEFPPLHYTFDRLEQMFPPEVMDDLRARPQPVSPTDVERLAMAAAGA